MNIDITLSYSIILITFMLILAFRIIDLRGSPVTKFLHSEDRVVDEDTLYRAVRGHGNLIEYAPLFLVLINLYTFVLSLFSLNYITYIKLEVISIIKPVNVSIMPPTRKIMFGFINEKTMPCISLPVVKIIPLECR